MACGFDKHQPARIEQRKSSGRNRLVQSGVVGQNRILMAWSKTKIRPPQKSLRRNPPLRPSLEPVEQLLCGYEARAPILRWQPVSFKLGIPAWTVQPHVMRPRVMRKARSQATWKRTATNLPILPIEAEINWSLLEVPSNLTPSIANIFSIVWPHAEKKLLVRLLNFFAWRKIIK